MNPTTLKIRRALAAVVLSAATVLVVVPVAQAGDNQVDDWFRDSTAIQANDHILDVSARDQVQSLSMRPSRTDAMYRNFAVSSQTAAAELNDHIVDVSARDAVPTPAGPSNDHILDVSARDSAPSGVTLGGTGGTDWQAIGLGVTLGGTLLLVVLVVAGLELRHSRHRLGSA